MKEINESQSILPTDVIKYESVICGIYKICWLLNYSKKAHH